MSVCVREETSSGSDIKDDGQGFNKERDPSIFYSFNLLKRQMQHPANTRKFFDLRLKMWSYGQETCVSMTTLPMLQ